MGSFFPTLTFFTCIKKAAPAAFLFLLVGTAFSQEKGLETNAWGFDAGWHVQHYSEPQMQLAGHGIDLRFQRAWSSRVHPWLPAFVSATASVGHNGYRSQNTGTLPRTEAAGAVVDLRWDLPNWWGLTWQTGPVAEWSWTDLRGTTSTGHKGYERLGTRLWWGLSVASSAENALHMGALLRGEQRSQLSQASDQLPDIRNTQSQGWFVRMEAKPVTERFRISPWIEIKKIQTSDSDRGWHEPKNTQISLGLRKAF
jgi:hypothetical protein